jgi:hypothetical protein
MAMKYPIVIEREAWINSQLSIARFTGGVALNGKEYYLVMGYDDLVCEDWVLVYANLGREKTIELLKNDTPLREAKKLLKERQKK